MITWSTADFSAAAGVSARTAREIFAAKRWRGYDLPVRAITGNRGGKRGQSYVLDINRCAPELRALLGLPNNPSSTAINPSVKGPSNIAVAQDRQSIIAPILATPPRSPERTAAFREVAAVPSHKVGKRSAAVSERTLREWVRLAEANGVAALLPKARSDQGARRVIVTRRWDQGCALPEAVQKEIATTLEGIARGLFKAGRSELNVRTLCSARLQRLTVDAGIVMPKKELVALCKLNDKWSARFREMRAVHAFQADNKAFTDRHEYHVRRGLTGRPMEVLMGDVHTVDLTIAAALASNVKELRAAASAAAATGEVSIRAWLIAWMDGSSGYMWATPVITGPGQGITQQDVANSLYEVLTCPWGGMPDTFVVDNGGEFGFLPEAVTRFAAMADMVSQKVIKCRPYHPEGKARLEGAFNVLEKGFVSALAGYNGGNILKPRLSARGKTVVPYGRGPAQLIADLHGAVALYNGTAQSGDLNGLSPKAMLESKAAATGWQAQQIMPQDAVMFDLVFSHQEFRDVLQGNLTIGGRRYSGPVLAELIGEKKVPVLVPFRDPEGPVIIFRDGVIHQLTCEVFGLADTKGAVRKTEMVAKQRAEIARRAATAAPVDVQQLLTDAADLGPVLHNEPNSWSFAIDKGGFLTAPVSEAEAYLRLDAEDREDINEFIAISMAGKREAAGATAGPSSAT